MVTRLLRNRLELRGSRDGSCLGVLEGGMQLRTSGRCLDSDVTCSMSLSRLTLDDSLSEFVYVAYLYKGKRDAMRRAQTFRSTG